MTDLQKYSAEVWEKLVQRCDRNGWTFREVDSSEGAYSEVTTEDGRTVVRVMRMTAQYLNTRVAVLAALEILA